MFQWLRDWRQWFREGGTGSLENEPLRHPTESPESEPTKWYVPPWHVCRVGDEFYVASYDTYQACPLHADEVKGLPVVSMQEGCVIVDMSIRDKDQIDTGSLATAEMLGMIRVDEIRFADRMNRAEIQSLESIAFVSKYNNDLANWLAGRKNVSKRRI